MYVLIANNGIDMVAWTVAASEDPDRLKDSVKGVKWVTADGESFLAQDSSKDLYYSVEPVEVWV